MKSPTTLQPAAHSSAGNANVTLTFPAFRAILIMLVSLPQRRAGTVCRSSPACERATRRRVRCSPEARCGVHHRGSPRRLHPAGRHESGPGLGGASRGRVDVGAPASCDAPGTAGRCPLVLFDAVPGRSWTMPARAARPSLAVARLSLIAVCGSSAWTRTASPRSPSGTQSWGRAAPSRRPPRMRIIAPSQHSGRRWTLAEPRRDGQQSGTPPSPASGARKATRCPEAWSRRSSCWVGM